MRFALVVSRFNEEITQGLMQGAVNYLDEKGVGPKPSDVFFAPGAFEIDLAEHGSRSLAQKAEKLPRQRPAGNAGHSSQFGNAPILADIPVHRIHRAPN